MADEKKPKIDLKARLGKTQVGAQQAPPPAGIPAPPAAGSSSAMAATPTPGIGLPVPPGVPVGPPPFGGGASSSQRDIDPSNPLAAVATPYRAPAPPPPQQPQFQRIEVDEGAVQEARKGARRMGGILALVVGVMGIAIGYVAGGANEKSAARGKSKGDAAELAQKVDEARAKIKTLNDKVEAGRTSLMQAKKYPTELIKDLGAINIDFDGGQLAGRRFSGFPTATTAELVDFVTSVQSLNDRKLFLQNQLTKLQKPITEQLAGPQVTITLMVVATKDGSALLEPLKDPIKVEGGQVTLPKEFNFIDTQGGGNAKIDKYNGGDLGKGAGFAVTPASFNKVCPSETAGQIAQLAAGLAGILRDIQGEKQPAGDIVQDTKPGLLDRADTLSAALKKVE
jgi:outer membrane murein-binding lipoprotein Lpp